MDFANASFKNRMSVTGSNSKILFQLNNSHAILEAEAGIHNNLWDKITARPKINF